MRSAASAIGARAAIRVRSAGAAGIVVITSRSHGKGPAIDAYLSEFEIAEHRLLGSAQKFGVVASGEADLYPRFGPTSEWDTCAGQAILEAAGGTCVTLAGARLAYGKPGFRNPDFIAAGNRRGPALTLRLNAPAPAAG